MQAQKHAHLNTKNVKKKVEEIGLTSWARKEVKKILYRLMEHKGHLERVPTGQTRGSHSTKIIDTKGLWPPR